MDANLLYQKHMGFNPRSGKNEPNRLYLADLEVTAKDVYIKREPLKSPEPLGTSGLLKKRQDLDYTNNLDTNRYNIPVVLVEMGQLKYIKSLAGLHF